jgi:pimeloyl-ACP methyl ester carboxylesterase
MRYFFLISMMFFSISVYGAPGDLLEIKEGAPFTTNEIQDHIDGFCSNSAPDAPPTIKIGAANIRFFAVKYESTNTAGIPVVVSGALFIPDTHEALPLVSYQHGTVFLRNDVPSRRNPEGRIIGNCYGSQGYAVAAADYLGYGDNPGYHPYMHVDSAATTSVDLLRAVRQAQKQIAVAFSDKLFLVGYSQGGANTMALHRLIERDFNTEFRVTAATPMAGPYDLEGAFLALQITPSIYSGVQFAYMARGMNKVYSLFSTMAEVIKQPIADSLESFYDGTHDLKELMGLIPNKLADLQTANFIEGTRDNSAHPFRQALRLNGTWDWKPIAPLLIIHGDADTVVPIASAHKAYERMQDLGAKVELKVMPGMTHEGGIRTAVPLSIKWLSAF